MEFDTESTDVQSVAQTDITSSDFSSASTLHFPPATYKFTIDFESAARKKRLRDRRNIRGHIPGVDIFTHWDTRRDCSEAGVHRPPVAGIHGNGKDGAYSIILSGMYEDDDRGDVIIYTGTGGRENPHRGPQTVNQSWDHKDNNALRVSCRKGNSVRVIRSHNCGEKYAPPSGYRYDGLYKVTCCWMENGDNDVDVCRCRLERLPGQPRIPQRDEYY